MVNKVILIGNVGRDPEARTFDGGNNNTSFSFATTKKYKKNNETVTETQWHNIVAWGKLADIINKYVKKGDKLYVEGEIQYQEYEKDGVKKYTTKINISEMKMMGDKKEQSNSAPQQQSSEVVTPEVVYENQDLPF